MGKESCHCHKVTKCVTSVTEWSCYTSQSQYMTRNMRTMGSEVHSHDSSCIYSVENQIETLLSFSCQLRLGVDLSCLG